MQISSHEHQKVLDILIFGQMFVENILGQRLS